MHIDLNAFFVTAEELRDPTLIGKPVIVGSVGRAGIVSTCSYEARKYGIRSGMPTFKATKLCKNVIIINSDHKYYSKLSKEFFSYIKTITDNIEPASIDEAFVDVTDVVKDKNATEFFKNLQRELYNKTHLKCSIGVAPTKFLAKMASDMKKPMGLTILRRRDFKSKIYPLPIADMYGIGKKTSPRLEALGIKTIGELAFKLNEDDKDVANLLGKFAYVLKDWLNGKGDDEVVSLPWSPKSIGNSTTLIENTHDYQTIVETIKELSKEISERAKKEDKKGKTIQLVIKDNHFRTRNKSITINELTNDETTIANKAIFLYEKYFDDQDVLVRLVGVTLQNLISPEDEIIQMSLFNYEKFEEESRTKLIINELNRKFGKDVLKRASEAKHESK